MATHLIAPDTTDDSRFERIEGQWVERPVPTTRHSRVQGRVFLLLTKAVEGSDAVVGPEWSIDQPEQADRDDPNYMTADVLVAFPPLTNAKSGHLAQPGFLAVEIFSPKQTNLFEKAERYGTWGTPHVWLINPETRDCFEFHGGRQFTAEREYLHAGDLTLSVASIFEGIE